MNVTVLGEGAFGTAIATMLAHNGHSVTLWCHDEDMPKLIEKTRENSRYLPHVLLDEKITPTHTLAQAFETNSYIFEAIPLAFLRSVVLDAKKFVQPEQIWVVLSKGIEQHSLLFPSHVIDDALGLTVRKAVLSGPSFARDLAQKKMTAVTLSSSDSAVSKIIETLCANDYFKLSLSDDFLGVQVCGAVKNCIALMMGLLHGAGYSEDTQSYIFTRLLHELTVLLQSLGCNMQTLYDFCGIGDIFLTCTGKQSRNREVGRRLGAGESLEAILATMNNAPEGVNTLIALQELCKKKNIQLQLLQKLYQVIFEKKSPSIFLR